MTRSVSRAGGRPPGSAWTAAVAAMLVAAVAHVAPLPLTGFTYDDVFLTSSYDGQTVHSRIQIPTGYDPLTPAPVLFAFHGANSPSGNNVVRLFEGPADDRGWFIAAPDMHGEVSGGQGSFGARAAQHDVIDLLEYMRANYSIDESRLYLTGPSMGGQVTSLMAEKYPHVFAAAYEWMGPSDLSKLYEEQVIRGFDWLADFIFTDTGGLPEDNAFEYDRRSPWLMAMNLKDVPFAIGHGTRDNNIGPWHARHLADAIESWNPNYFNGIFWFDGGHRLDPEHRELICAWLENWTRVPWPEDLFMWVDESQDYYYVDVVQDNPDKWARFRVDLTPPDGILAVQLNVRRMTLHLEDTPIDPAMDLALTVWHAADNTLIVTGLIDTLDYTLFHEGVEYGAYTYANGTLTIEIADASPDFMNFTIVPN